jgi:hypothetical protein
MIFFESRESWEGSARDSLAREFKANFDFRELGRKKREANRSEARQSEGAQGAEDAENELFSEALRKATKLLKELRNRRGGHGFEYGGRSL